MNDLSSPHEMDDRSPYDVGLATLRVIAQHSDLADEKAVQDRIMEAISPESFEYLTSIARTRHSIFYHQLQDLYEFGKELVHPEARADFCFHVGGEFAKALLAETLHPLQEVALASDADFQKKIAEIIELYTVRQTGDKYLLVPEFGADTIAITVCYRVPELVQHYLEDCGLELELCFRNSAQVIAGAIGHFASQLTAGYDSSAFEIEFDGLAAPKNL